MSRKEQYPIRIATALAVAFVVCAGCNSKLKEAEALVLSESPTQRVSNMFAVQSKDGVVIQRVEAPIMEKYERDTASLDCFPEGLAAYMYTEEGLLETTIRADYARHETGQRNKRNEDWQAFGNVVINNVIKGETLETDTLYWDRKGGRIYTDAYVKMHSSDGLMQGKGLESDERARNATLLNPFDSFGYSEKDSTRAVTDTANFIGPLL